jgi:Mrp family chromosome partitioning ATPase
MQPLARARDSAPDEAEVREEILRDLRARATSAAIAQPRLRTLAAAIARTGGSMPAPGGVIEPGRVVVLASAEERRPPGTSRPAVAAPPAPTPTVESPPAQTALVAQSTALALRGARTGFSDDRPFGEGRPLDPRLLLLCEPDSQRAAGFRLLRDNLLAKKAPRIIAVSSGSPHEGKTTCAINLALAFSEKPSTKVLLMEGNFFVPSLGDIFHVAGPDPRTDLPMLAPYCIVPMMRDFHVAALAQRPGEIAPTFNSRWFEMVIGHLSGADYDYLVIDAAALDGAPAVAQLIGLADGVLLTVRSEKTTARGLRRAAEQIPPGRALGVTLMDGES